MRVSILSDLHQEFGVLDLPRPEADLIVLAGDIHTKCNALPWIRSFCRDTPAAYVCGNHEFYGDRLPRVAEKLIDATRGTNVHVLEDSHFDVNDWHVYGCTLWTDMALIEPWQDGAALAWEKMNDYKRIRNSVRGYRRLLPKDTRNLHLRSVERLDAFFAHHEPQRTIVVTHHAPPLLSLSEQWRTEPISCAYASHLDKFIQRHQPRLWIHGHIHHSNDYFIGKTRVISNPQGYPEHPNRKFDPGLMVEM